ncbi:MAG: ATP-binding protein [Deltaproteobacteria bacterium]|nr:ATP-binding protein [Deltaproteobacteria bacterium]
MAFIGFLVAVLLFIHVKKRLSEPRARLDALPRGDEEPCGHDWHGHWAKKFQRKMEREQRRWERHAARAEKRFGVRIVVPPIRIAEKAAADATDAASDAQVLARARRRARVEVGFYTHLMSYLGIIALLALINLLTTSYPWFIWPALGWGVGVFSHYMAVFGGRVMRERYFEPAVEREVRRERVAMQSEKQASIDELSSTLAHEIRNPIAAAKSLVQQMGEDPTSVENVEYAKVAMDELDRVEKRISHLLRYAKEEDYQFAHCNLANVVDAALTQLRAKLDGAQVRVTRNYIGGPTVNADLEKLKQVFVNVLDNAIDALSATDDRHVDLFIENGGKRATVRLRDNGAGISPEKLEKIFNPFFTTKGHGTGLGMAISKKIVEAHEGTIDVVSEPGRGTEFAVTLPLPQ